MENNNKKQKLRIGITGSTGVLGNRMVEMLLADNSDITCLIRKSSQVDYDASKVNIIYGDLNDLDSVRSFIKDIDVCLHLAAQVSLTKKEVYHLVNVQGTENLCKTILEVNPDCKLVNCSSIAAYRMTSIFRAQYTDYAKSKYAADQVVESYRKHGLRCATVVPGMIYGPGKNKFIPTVIDYLKGENVYFVSGGEKDAPLTYIDDLCELFALAALDDRSIGNKYFAFGNTEIGIHDFIRMIADKVSLEVPSIKKFPKSLLMLRAIGSEFLFRNLNISKTPKYTKRMVDVLSINYKLSKEQKANNLGWMPKVDAETGLNNTLRCYGESVSRS